MIQLGELARCFEAVIPGMLTTCAADGTPNIIAVSHVHRIDDRHLALSRQFFRKTQENLTVNPYAEVAVMDPLTLDTYRITLRHQEEQTEGPIFDVMAARVDAVASMTGMAGVFRMQAASVFEVLSIELVPGVHMSRASDDATGLAAIDSMTQLRALRRISDCVREANDAERLLDAVLAILDEVLGFEHSMILLCDETGERLTALASRGYRESGIGAEVRVGEGIIGTVARTRRLLRVSSLRRELRYSRAQASAATAAHEIPLPGLPDAQSQLAIPLIAKHELLGVLAVESRRTVSYGERDEAFLDIVAGQVALGLRGLLRAEADERAAKGPTHRFLFYERDDCVFLDGEYLVRNVPGRILWKLLQAYVREGREEFSNRELRLDGTLGLPALRDNLESRLILLRKRLAEKSSCVRLVSAGRGRLRLEVQGRIELEVKRG